MINPGGRTVIGSRGPGDPERRSNRGKLFPHWVTEGLGADIERVTHFTGNLLIDHDLRSLDGPLTTSGHY